MSQPHDPQNPYGDQPTAPYGQTPSSPPPSGSYGGTPTPAAAPTAAVRTAARGSYGGGGGPYGGGGPPAGQPSGKGFFGALFDMSFTTFVTPMIIKVVYIIGLIAIGLGTLFFAVSGFFGDNPGFGIVTLIVSPLVGLLYLCFFRMMCEFYVAITRMSEDINRRLPQS